MLKRNILNRLIKQGKSIWKSIKIELYIFFSISMHGKEFLMSVVKYILCQYDKKKKSQVEGWCHQDGKIGDPSIPAPWTSTIEQLFNNTDISERA